MAVLLSFIFRVAGLLDEVLYNAPEGGYPMKTQITLGLIFYGIPLAILVVIIIALIILVHFVRKNIRKKRAKIG
jgi:hypothetical protein